MEQQPGEGRSWTELNEQVLDVLERVPCPAKRSETAATWMAYGDTWRRASTGSKGRRHGFSPTKKTAASHLAPQLSPWSARWKAAHRPR